MIKNVLFAILLLLNAITGAGGFIVLVCGITDDKYMDPVCFIISMILIFIWVLTIGAMESKYMKVPYEKYVQILSKLFS